MATIAAPDLRSVHVAVLDSSPARHTALAAMAGWQGWDMHACDRPGGILDAIDDGDVDLVVVNWSDVEDADALLGSVEVPVVALADDDEGVKAALRHGACLALRTSCDPEVLKLSMLALLRPRPLEMTLHERVCLGDLMVHLANHTVERRGRRQVLSPTEWQLFAFLLAHPRRTFDRDQLTTWAWGDRDGQRRHEIDLYVFRLRRKVERQPRVPVLIETVRNHGYRLTVAPVSLGN